MYPTLRAELARRNINDGEAAKILGISPSSFSCKMSRKSEFTYNEALKLKNVVLKIDMPLEVLFEEAVVCQ